jgi:glycosyltransferase involved in cell wall biosynthesis
MLALAMIARDEQRCIARCLQSVRPFVDHMLVVDTGSGDATAALARAEGAQVESFPWCDDFSAARNFSLARVEALWPARAILVLDADEWVVSGGPGLRLPAGPGESGAGRALLLNEFDDGGVVRISTSRVTRLLPRGTRYRGRVHEQPVVAGPVRDLDLHLGHDGYRDLPMDSKRGRNSALLEAELAADPLAPYPRYQLGKDLELRGAFGPAVQAYDQARGQLGVAAAPGCGQGALRAWPWLHDLIVRRIYCAKRAGQFEEGLALALADAGLLDASPDYHFAVGDLLLDAAIRWPAQAAQLLPRIEASWLRCLQVGEQPGFEGAVAGRGSYLAAQNLAAFHQAQGQEAEAAQYRSLALRLQGGPA